MSRRTGSIVFFVVAGTIMLGAGALAIGELRDPATCPDLLGVPACYFVLGCAALVLASRALRDPARVVVFFVGAGPAFGLALVASLLQMTGRADCPKGPGGVPMCYLSLVLFGTLAAIEALRLNRLRGTPGWRSERSL